MKYLIISLLALSPNVILAKAWDYYTSTPEIMGHYYTKNFNEIPIFAQVKSESKYWSGHYWPYNEGSINNRWNARNFRYLPELVNKEEISKLRIPEIAALSPSEKLDLLNGNYHYPFVHEVAKVYNTRAKNWEGICNGWAAASLNHNEPEPKVLVNPDGIEIPFGSTDIKALLSYYYAYGFRPLDTHQMGVRCNERKKLSSFECNEDLNPGAFHVVLGNRIGLESESFIADTERGQQVSNHPIWGFYSEVLSEEGPQKISAPGTTRVLKMKTVVIYVKGMGVNWRPVLRTKNQGYFDEIYHYYLELDEKSNIIGGEWISSNRPDFIWRMEKPRTFEGHFKLIPELLYNE